MSHGEKCIERGKKDGQLRRSRLDIEFRATVLIVGADGDDKAVSPENAEIDIRLCFECDLIETKD